MWRRGRGNKQNHDTNFPIAFLLKLNRIYEAFDKCYINIIKESNALNSHHNSPLSSA